MKDSLFDHLQDNRRQLVKEWHRRICQTKAQENLQTEFPTVKTVDKIFSELLAIFRDEGENDRPLPVQQIENYAGNGVRIKLPFMIEVFLIGEEVIGERLYLQNDLADDSACERAAEDVERLNGAFHTLIRQQTQFFCVHCLKPLLTAHQVICKLEQPVSELNQAFLDAKKVLQPRVKEVGYGG